MQTTQIEAFIQVVECGSFNRAAEELFISQPALRKRIGMLEDELDVELFSRNNSGCVLTEAGRVFYDGIVPMKKELSDLVASVRSLKEKMLIRFSQSPDYPNYLMDIFFRNFCVLHPQIILERVVMPSSKWIDALISGATDICPMNGTTEYIRSLESKGIRAINHGKEQISCFVSPNHPLACHTALTISELVPWEIHLPPLYFEVGIADYCREMGLTVQREPRILSRVSIRGHQIQNSAYLYSMNWVRQLEPLICIPIEGFEVERFLAVKDQSLAFQYLTQED